MQVRLAGNVWKVYDISPVLSAQLAVFPGDQAYSQQVSKNFAAGDSYTLSAISTTVHAGAHVDAPLHYHPDGVDIAQRSLSYYMGPCQVLEPAVAAGHSIGVKHLPRDPLAASRVLFKTGSYPDPNSWCDSFCYLEPELIAELAARGVLLIGIDTPSIDAAHAAQLASHNAVYRYNMAILEGIVLEAVPPGLYELLAVPLPLAAADASPVRALLLQQER